MDMPYGEVDRIAKLIPPTIGITIEQALKDSPPLSQAYNRTEDQGADRHGAAAGGSGARCGRACGGCSDCAAAADGARTGDAHEGRGDRHSYDMKAVEKMGLLKMDFLGLTTLTVIDDCLKLIKANRGEDVDMATIALDDQQSLSRCFTRR